MPDDFFYCFLHSGHFGWTVLRVAVIIITTLLILKALTLAWKLFKKTAIHLMFIKNVLRIIILTAGIVLALREIPLFSDITIAIVAGSGILAFAFGFAAQESLSNALNGMFISIFRPFEVGDRIHLVNANITGFIEDISIRHTVIRTFMNSRIIVPNSVMSRELIENSNFCNPLASAFIDVTVTYDSDITKACEVIAQVIGGHKEFVDTRTAAQLEANAPKVPVFVRNLGLYGVELRASMWTAHISLNFAACSDVRKEILTEFAKLEIKIASSKIIDALIHREE